MTFFDSNIHLVNFSHLASRVLSFVLHELLVTVAYDALSLGFQTGLVLFSAVVTAEKAALRAILDQAVVV